MEKDKAGFCSLASLYKCTLMYILVNIRYFLVITLKYSLFLFSVSTSQFATISCISFFHEIFFFLVTFPQIDMLCTSAMRILHKVLEIVQTNNILNEECKDAVRANILGMESIHSLPLPFSKGDMNR